MTVKEDGERPQTRADGRPWVRGSRRVADRDRWMHVPGVFAKLLGYPQILLTIMAVGVLAMTIAYDDPRERSRRAAQSAQEDLERALEGLPPAAPTRTWGVRESALAVAVGAVILLLVIGMRKAVAAPTGMLGVRAADLGVGRTDLAYRPDRTGYRYVSHQRIRTILFPPHGRFECQVVVYARDRRTGAREVMWAFVQVRDGSIRIDRIEPHMLGRELAFGGAARIYGHLPGRTLPTSEGAYDAVTGTLFIAPADGHPLRPAAPRDGDGAGRAASEP
ncbi:hypothetical protein [Bifidobacterium platyrrhinorum]|nr:hypothetical protein [Bifidobacterium platyrrhinorum]